MLFEVLISAQGRDGGIMILKCSELFFGKRDDAIIALLTRVIANIFTLPVC